VPYKDPAKQRQAAREWIRRKKAAMSGEERERFREGRREYKRKYRIRNGSKPRVSPPREVVAESKPIARMLPAIARERVRWCSELNRMVLILEDGTIKDCGFGKTNDPKPLPW
jgi:hypothetical protein